MEQQQIFPQDPQPSLIERNRLLIKGFLIAFLILLMLIPAAFIHQLVVERASRQSQVVKEVSEKWGGAQTIIGPILVVPYNYVSQGADGKVLSIRKVAQFLPDVLDINGRMEPTVRHRSIYDVTLYRSPLTFGGSFNPLPLSSLGIDPQNVHWNEAKLIFSISDTRGLEQEVALNWNGSSQMLEPGVPENNAFVNGLSAPIALAANGTYKFNISVPVRGSQELSFSPLGRTTTASLTSPWKTPSSIGDFVPISSQADRNGFHSTWRISQASRPFPQAWKDGAPDLKSHTFGTNLIQPADSYAKTERSVKYAILFIGLTFIVFFFIEVLQKRQVHPLQYILVGFALCVFYTLLLSISEFLGFDAAYLIAALATVSLIGWYVWSVFHSGQTAGAFTFALSCLYGYIYVLIRLEDSALIAGSIGLFIILAIIMYFSRKIDWYGTNKSLQTANR